MALSGAENWTNLLVTPVATHPRQDSCNAAAQQKETSKPGRTRVHAFTIVGGHSSAIAKAPYRGGTGFFKRLRATKRSKQRVVV